MKLVLSARARRRLREIQTHVAADSPAAAASLVERILDRMAGLEAHPHLGRPLPEEPGAYREVIQGNYRIVYRVAGETVRVLTVFEGHRLLHPAELREE